MASATVDATPLDVRRGLTSPSGTSHPLRWGILGAGGISSDWAKALLSVPGATLSRVAARSVESATNFAEKHGVAAVSTTYEELVASDDVDIVYVGTITPLHKEHALLAIKAGKHCLCEKPLAESANDAAEMFAAAEDKGVMLQEGLWTRFFPAVEHARSAVEAGKIGTVQMASADFPDRVYAAQVSPLAFGENAKPSRVVASCCRDGSGGAVVQYEDQGTTILTFPSWGCEFAEELHLTGTSGRLKLSGYGHAPTTLTIYTIPPGMPPEPQGHLSTSQNGVQPIVEKHVYPVPQPTGYPAMGWHYTNQTGFVYQAEAVHRCLAAGLRECPQYTKAESLHVLYIMDRVSAADSEGEKGAAL